MKALIVGAALTFWYLFVSLAVIAGEKTYRFTVEVAVAGEGPLKNRIESCIKKELRALNDVKVSSDHPDFFIVIVALEAKSKANDVLGGAVAVSTLAPYKPDAASKAFPKGYQELFKLGTRDLYYNHGTELYLNSLDDLPSVCNEIVSNFDVARLEKERNRPLILSESESESEISELIIKGN